MSDNCPVCKTELKETSTQNPDFSHPYNCPRCGKFVVDDDLESYLPQHIMSKGIYDEEKAAILSHAIRKMQKKDAKHGPRIDEQLIEAILKRPLPSLNEQVNNFIIWLAENTSYGESHEIHTLEHQSIAGAKNHEGFVFVLDYLIDLHLLSETQRSLTGDHIKCFVTLTVDGWQHYEQLQRGTIGSRKAFMAMKYDDKELDKIVEDHFTPAVAATGFELYRLDTEPKAGLIDDRLRVEIRNSRFLISDLTHDNNGAYWEAGYAEGLGKPVIYTCKKEKFDSDKSHFDTNHHLTVKWDAKKIGEAVEMLKATIRATLPDEAKLSDD